MTHKQGTGGGSTKAHLTPAEDRVLDLNKEGPVLETGAFIQFLCVHIGCCIHSYVWLIIWCVWISCMCMYFIVHTCRVNYMHIFVNVHVYSYVAWYALILCSLSCAALCDFSFEGSDGWLACCFDLFLFNKGTCMLLFMSILFGIGGTHCGYQFYDYMIFVLGTDGTSKWWKKYIEIPHIVL